MNLPWRRPVFQQYSFSWIESDDEEEKDDLEGTVSPLPPETENTPLEEEMKESDEGKDLLANPEEQEPQPVSAEGAGKEETGADSDSAPVALKTEGMTSSLRSSIEETHPPSSLLYCSTTVYCFYYLYTVYTDEGRRMV